MTGQIRLLVVAALFAVGVAACKTPATDGVASKESALAATGAAAPGEARPGDTTVAATATTGVAGQGAAVPMGGSAGTGGGVAYKCGPDPACARCTLGVCCGSSCCAHGEWCDESSGTPTCKCANGPACNAPKHCVAPKMTKNTCGYACFPTALGGGAPGEVD